MTRVAGSALKASTKSDSERSARLPSETNPDRPPRLRAQSRMAVPRAPDCVMMAMDPSLGMTPAKDAFK
jgi:hypothetical protein